MTTRGSLFQRVCLAFVGLLLLALPTFARETAFLGFTSGSGISLDYDEAVYPVGSTYADTLTVTVNGTAEDDIGDVWVADAGSAASYSPSHFHLPNGGQRDIDVTFPSSYGSLTTLGRIKLVTGEPVEDSDTVTIVQVTIANPTGDPTNSEQAAEGQNEFTFDNSEDGYCRVKCQATLNPDNTATTSWAEDNLVWSITAITGSELKWGAFAGGTFTEEDNKGKLVHAQFKGLPSSNDQFGDKTVTLAVGNITPPLTAAIQVFYTKTATNHPADVGKTDWPNWLYYWSQTVTLLGNPAPSIKYSANTQFVPGTTEIEIADDCEGTYSAPYGTSNPLNGIDNFAWSAIHESQHYKDWCDLWGNNYFNWYNNHRGKTGGGDDKDCDWIPNNTHNVAVEDVDKDGTYNAGDLYDWEAHNTPTAGRPEAIINDFEDWNCQRNKDVTGDHSKDWANPGMQHGTNDKYDD